MFVWPVRVYYEDTDSGGVVYYANYLKFMERARTEWLRARGLEQDALLREQRVMFAVRSLTVDYHRPARFNDLLVVHSRIVEERGASFLFEQTIQRDASADILCGARVRVACIDAETFRARRIPRHLRETRGDCR
ncbi:MAG: tol-pal system-associated acyl-CoA thioesterase [Candidatus Competibacteraceae bacterium]|nr:tol-pal system-associated acyl-CoA thioesterase [Candidatus Competibacteraceae bacterium]MBK7984826.1 tol-pal system-associated acyl-CoA thioesterase [Candidatus Competibacteraceae bacterium]MBK8899411.1 tol-pal system-associated acyl-CoA thioesterase [Candidatus Competibacteraceae bacterium]MBK8964416.1 tol-pal system-associated acyl-CoA thioesterase [Candidatus Competibacteraceae bacterium]MBK9952405.1 tol-pal system-associated acyl-CoA thioesterase [Candidatus Competibacteraceae bacterium